MQVKLIIKQNNINLNWKLAQPTSTKLRTRAHEDTPVAAKMKYLMMESKLCILEENYSRAEEHAGKALNKGKQFKF